MSEEAQKSFKCLNLNSSLLNDLSNHYVMTQILIGRGNVDVKPKLVMSEVRKARNALIHIITIAVQPDGEGRQLMARIATEPSGAFELDSFTQLYGLHEPLIQHVFDGQLEVLITR